MSVCVYVCGDDGEDDHDALDRSTQHQDLGLLCLRNTTKINTFLTLMEVRIQVNMNITFPCHG